MTWAVVVVRTLLGLLFVWGGVAYFGKLMDAPPPAGGSPAATFFEAVGPTGYMDAVKVVELVGGVLLLTGRLAPLGITLITPVAVNILFFELFLLRAPSIGVGVTAACLFLMWGYRSYFARFFRPDARVGLNWTRHPRRRGRPMSVLRPGGGRMVAVAGDVYTLKLSAAETGGRCSVLEFVVPPGGGPPPHTHTREEEAFYVTEGELTFTVGGEVLVVGPGGFAHPPLGVPHSFTNRGTTPAKAVVVLTPGGLEELFFEVGTPWADPARFPGPPTPDEIGRIKAAAPKYGIVLGPPPGGHA